MSYKTAIQIHKQNSTVALIFSENQISMVTSIVNVNDNSVICIQKNLIGIMRQNIKAKVATMTYSDIIYGPTKLHEFM